MNQGGLEWIYRYGMGYVKRVQDERDNDPLLDLGSERR